MNIDRRIAMKTNRIAIGVIFVFGVMAVLIPGCRAQKSYQATACISEITGNCEAGYAEANDITMYFEIHGSGDPLLIMHGATGYIEDMKPQIIDLSQAYRVIAPDSRGHGRTSDSDQPLSYELMAKDMIALMDILGLEKVHVIGHSMGGTIGLELAINFPERVDRLVTIGASFSPEGMTDEYKDFLETTDVDYILPEMVYQLYAPDPSNWPVLLEKLRVMMLNQPDFTRDELAKVKTPTLVMAGENEDTVRPDHTEDLYQMLGNAEIYIVAYAGHVAPRDNPEDVNQAILKFLGSEK
jgi:pimeloyl-ACP methyl ester carboxylesterase